MKGKSESESEVVSESSRPHGLQPTRLLHPWDFPGKSTGVGCHCLLPFLPKVSQIGEENENIPQRLNARTLHTLATGRARITFLVPHLWTTYGEGPTGCQRRQWHSTPVLLPGKSHGWRSLVGCSPWGRSESDTTEQLHFHFSLSCTGKENGNPLQCS